MWRSAVAIDEEVIDAYGTLITNAEFQEAVESDTAGVPHTVSRIRLWGEHLNEVLQTNVPLPQATPENSIVLG